jgi:hypothetical protein
VLTRPRSRRPDDVVLFVRTLTGAAAGGTRAVLARASLYASAGHRVTLVVLGVTNDEEWARRAGLLHPAVRTLYLWRDGPRAADHARAARLEPLAPPRVADGDLVTRRVRDKDGVRMTRTFVDRALVTQESVDASTGVTQSFVTYRDDGTRATNWRFVDGHVVAIDHLGDGRLERRFVVDGRAEWLVADITDKEGTGRADFPGGDRPSTDVGDAVAQWLDDEFAESGRVVVFADGENVWQRALRRMRHPGLRGVSVLHNSHLDAPYDANAPTKAHWEGYLKDTTNVSAMVCLTHRQQRDLLERYPELPLRVLRHAAAKPRIRRTRRDARTIVSLGRLAPQKQLDHLLRAFRLVVDQVPDARLAIYGHGPSEPALRELANELGLEDRVRFLGRTDKALEAFASARVAAMTSLHEGLPLTLTEAMSVGTPFVAYDCNYGPAEVIRDGENGYLVPTGDTRLLADRLTRLLSDDALARRTSRSARAVTREFSAARYRLAWLGLLADVSG